MFFTHQRVRKGSKMAIKEKQVFPIIRIKHKIYPKLDFIHVKNILEGVLGHKLFKNPKFEVFCDQLPGTWSQSGHILVTWSQH